MFIPSEDSSKKVERTSKPGTYFGLPDSSETNESKKLARAIHTMSSDIADEKRRLENLSQVESAKETAQKRGLLGTIWSKISGKASAEEKAILAAKEEQAIKLKKEEENKESKAKAEIEAAKLAEENERAQKEKEAALKAAEDLVRAKREKEAAMVIIAKEEPEVPASQVARKEVTPAPTAQAEPSSDVTPAALATRNRAVMAASSKAAKIMAMHEESLTKTVHEASQIAEERERVRNSIAKIVEEEEKALNEVIGIVEKEERARAQSIKEEATRKRAAAEADADQADSLLIKKQREATDAENLAKRLRAEAAEAEVTAKIKRTLATTAVETEAEEISQADKQVQIAVDAATKEVLSLQSKAREEAGIIANAQDVARRAEAAEIETLKKTGLASS